MSNIDCCTKIKEYKDNRFIDVCKGTCAQLIVEVNPQNEDFQQIGLWFDNTTQVAKAINQILQLEGTILAEELQTKEYIDKISSKIRPLSSSTKTVDKNGRIVAVGRNVKSGLISMLIIGGNNDTVCKQREDVLLTLSKEQETLDIRILLYFYILQQSIIKEKNLSIKNK